jgi:hypothetical protein
MLVGKRIRIFVHVAQSLGAAAKAAYSLKCLEKLSEKGRKGLQRSPTDHPRAHFFLRIPAEFTLGALLVPLFGPFLERLSGK